MSIHLDIKDPNDKMILKFVGGLHHNLRHELVMFPLPSLHEAYRLTLNIEARRKVSTILEGKAKPKASFTPSTSNTSLRGKKWSTFDRSKKCGHCGKVGHEEVDCFKLHLEKAPCSLLHGKKKTEDKKVIDVMITSDEPDPTLVLVNTQEARSDRERLFTFKMQVKQRILSAILDNGSQKNLISSSIVQEMGLPVMDHLNPYELSG